MFNDDVKHTGRGFRFYEFNDRNNETCTIQKSSIATEDCVWLGIDDAKPLIMANDAKKLGIDTDKSTGWIDYPIPENVLLTTRMHLTRDQAKQLSKMLNWFAESGELPKISDII